MHILHFALDDKFIPLQADMSEEAFPGATQLRILPPDGATTLHTTESASLRYVDADYFDGSAELRADIAQADCVLVHGMTHEFAGALEYVPDAVLVLWGAWGYEYVNELPHLGSGLLPSSSDHQRRLAWRRRLLQVTNADRRRRLIRRLRGRFVPNQTIDRFGLLAAARHLDLVNVNPVDLPKIHAAIPDFTADYHHFAYYTTEDTFAVGVDMAGPDILLGNSASPTNNHIPAMELLKEVDLTGRRIFVPLSYGDDRYARHVAQLGNRWFGDAFVAMIDFLPLADYNEAVSRCGTAILNHVRQQGIGNASMALYKGATLYLRPESTLHPFFTEMGAFVRDVDDLPTTLNDPQSDEQRQANRDVVGEYWSRKRGVDALRGLAPRVAAHQDG